MFMKKIKNRVVVLEKQELEAENGQANPQLYSELYASYLYQSDLCGARHLWMRMPERIKHGNAELEKLHKIYLALWNNNSSDFFKLIQHEWSKEVADIMSELKDKIKYETISLIGKAYTTIFENTFMEMTDTEKDKVEEVCKHLEWEIEDGKFPRLIYPKKKLIENGVSTTAEEQLHILTDFVSFLEN